MTLARPSGLIDKRPIHTNLNWEEKRAIGTNANSNQKRIGHGIVWRELIGQAYEKLADDEEPARKDWPTRNPSSPFSVRWTEGWGERPWATPPPTAQTRLPSSIFYLPSPTLRASGALSLLSLFRAFCTLRYLSLGQPPLSRVWWTREQPRTMVKRDAGNPQIKGLPTASSRNSDQSY